MFGKKPILFVFTLLAALSLHLFLSEKKNIEANSSASDSFTEQWRLMKKPENRDALTQNSSNWHLHDQLQERAFKRKYFSAIEKVKFQGPKSVGGRTRDLIIDASNNNRYLAASISGGIWVSENKGGKWQPVNDQGANLNATCIDQSPINNALVIYGTGEPQGNSSGAPGQGVFLSTDTGKTFAPIMASIKAPGMDYIWEVKFDLKNENTFYVACSNGNLYRTTNLGNSFQKVYSAQNEITEIEVFESGKVMVAVNSVGILMSESGDSASFSMLTKGLPANGFQRISITHCARFPDVVFAQFAQKKTSVGVYKSSNGGKTWQDMANPQGFRGDYSLAWYALVLEISPFDTNFLMSGSVKLMYSVDGAKSWDVALRGHADQHSVVFNNDDSTHFLVGSDGGVHSYNTSTVKSKFQNLNGNYYSSQFFALGYGPSGNAFMGGTQDNGTHYFNITQDDEKYVLGSDGGYCHIHQQDTNLAYASTQEGGLEKSTNINSINPGFLPIIKDLDKNNDGQLDDGAWFITPFEMNYLNGDELFVVTKNKVWLSKNQGENWSQLINSRLNPYTVAISNQKVPEQVFIGGEGMLLLRVDNPNSHT
ncbi:MAG: hypothetical protein KDC92_15920, partial [Bacteroidetes bacterium]|nr:hypothetical protein [Bacteroidota bacterium]